MGWFVLAIGALSVVADIEGTLQLGTRILGTPFSQIPDWLPWMLGGSGICYLTWLWYVDYKNEPLRQLLRLAAIQALQHFHIVSENIERVLGRSSLVGRLAQLALEDARGNVQRCLNELIAVIEKPSLSSRLSIRLGETRLVAFLNSYERAVYRLRDAGLASNFDFQSNGNFREWKRFDTELVSGVWRLISKSRYEHVRGGLENSIWKDGIREYL